MTEMTNRIALVTGAASGIGLATAKLLAAGGGRVALFARDPQAVAEAARSIGGAAMGVAVDVGVFNNVTNLGGIK